MMQIPVRKLQQDVATRWNSSLFMLESLLHSRWSVSAVISDTNITDRKYRYLDLQADQWELAEKLVIVLKPLQVATTFLSSKLNVSASCILPVLTGLVQSLTTSEDHHSVIRQFKSTVVCEIERRWSLKLLDPSSLLVISCALDPRFKQLKFLNSNERELVKEALLSKMELMEASEDAEQPTEPPAKRPTTALDILLGPEEDSNDESSSALSDELQGYLATKAASKDTNPLVWWEANGYNHPHIAKIAKALFSIPAKSTPTERIFSKSGLIVNDLRSTLKPDMVNALLFLNKNLSQLS